jgi:hypothetical protein
MSPKSKEKLEIYQLMPIQQTIVVIDSSPSALSLKKRKEDASKPLYLKRV